MIRKNRKKRLHSFVLPAPLSGVVVAGALLALSYVWLDCRCESLGRDIKNLEAEKVQLKKDLLSEESRWSKMKSPANIEAVLAKHNIVMTWPRQDQVVRLSDAGVNAGHQVKKSNNSLTYMKRDKAVIHD